MNSKVEYGIEHPKKGLIGLSTGEAYFPNENDPENINLLETFLSTDFE